MKINMLIFTLLFSCNCINNKIQPSKHEKAVMDSNILPVNTVEKSNCQEYCLKLTTTKFEKNYFLNNAILSYNIINNSNFTIVSGDDYLIEQKINKSWKNINLDAFFNSIGYIIKPNEVKNLQMKTRYIKKLKPGYYRIKKEILILPSKRTTLLIQEFEIQK
ncbi:immunoglobulin-like domain-containing protein [Kaistella sp.]|uniref:immunoglobulin-like domain-containing protein n=1 Tax=Kaistella sp. TaxID=2782235 RepID=UPI002F91F379